MKLREPSLVSLTRPGMETLSTTGWRDVTLLELYFCDGVEVALADAVRDARPRAIGALFARVPGRGLEDDLRRFRGQLRVDTAHAPTRQ